MTFWRTFINTLLVVVLLAGAFAAGYLLRDRMATGNQFPVFEQAYELLLERGLNEPPNPPALEYGMIRGMLQAYNDPYTIFVEPIQHELEGNQLQGSFGGIGVRIGTDAEGFWVIYPYPDSPALIAGLQEGDRLLFVDELAIGQQTSLDALQSAIRGPVGETVKLKIGRPPAYEPVEVLVKRAEIPLPSVTWHRDPGEPLLGVVEINIIAASTADEIVRAVEDLQSKGATHFVLDLRNNPGGLLTAGVDVARLFLKEGVIMEQQYKGRGVDTFRVEQPGPLAEIPLIVIINEGSASAAEIVAGALKAHKRASLIGSHSYGKDSIQLVFDLKDGSSLHVTAARWWTPGLPEPMGGVGIQPDIPAASSGEPGSADPAIQAAIDTFFK